MSIGSSAFSHSMPPNPGPERVHLDVGDLEPGVSGASSGGEPARFRYQDPGEVGAENMTAAGGAHREDGHITATAPDVENVLPVLDLRGREQPRRQPAQHPLMPFTLLDELPPTGSVPVLGLLCIHRHEGHAMPGPVPDAPFGTLLPEIATVAGACQNGEFCAQPLVRSTQRQTTPNRRYVLATVAM